jgi:hypothetical protein
MSHLWIILNIAHNEMKHYCIIFMYLNISLMVIFSINCHKIFFKVWSENPYIGLFKRVLLEEYDIISNLNLIFNFNLI